MKKISSRKHAYNLAASASRWTPKSGSSSSEGCQMEKEDLIERVANLVAKKLTNSGQQK